MKLKRYYFPIVICANVLAVWSCNKSGDAVPSKPVTSALNVINAVTDIRAIDLYLNGTRQNTSSAIYLYNASGYLSVLTGEQQFQFKSDTDRTLLADIKLIPARSDSSYTLVAAGQQSKGTFTTIFMTDLFPVDTTTAAKVRFVQAAPGTNAYDVFVGDTLSFRNKAFKAYTGFQKVGPGKKNIKVNLAGTTTTVFTGTLILQPGSYYTMYTRGGVGLTGNNALGVSANLSK